MSHQYLCKYKRTTSRDIIDNIATDISNDYKDHIINALIQDLNHGLFNCSVVYLIAITPNTYDDMMHYPLDMLTCTYHFLCKPLRGSAFHTQIGANKIWGYFCRMYVVDLE